VNPRRIFQAAAVVLWSLIVGVGVAEVAVRVFVDDGYYVWPPGYETNFHPNPEIVHGVSPRARITINSDGVRGDLFGPDPQYRLLAVGGSTTMGLFLDDTEAWPHLAQNRLNAVLGPGAVWVGNVGRPGHTSVQNAPQIDRLLEQHPQIDAILVMIGANDLLVRLTFHHFPPSLRTSPWFSTDRRDAPLLGAFAYVPKGSFQAPWYGRTSLGHFLAMRLRHFELAPTAVVNADASNIRHWRGFRRGASQYLDQLPDLRAMLSSYARNLGRVVEIVRKHEARIVFVTQPSLWREDLTEAQQALLWAGGPPLDRLAKDEKYYSVSALAEGMERFNAQLLESCRELDLECIDLAAQVPRETTMFFDGVHFTEAGSRRVASVVVDYLLASPPLSEPAR